MPSTNDNSPVSRRDRRKAETRAKLLDAAHTVFARDGLEATRISDITEEADVGFGSFYNHFESKEAIAAAVLEQAVGQAGAAIAAASADIADPAEVVALAHRRLIGEATANHRLGWLLVRLDMTHDVVRTVLAPYAAEDLQRGIDAGRFHISDPLTVLVGSGGALLSVIRETLEGRLGPGAAEAHTEGMLRMLGVAPDDAAEVARRPLR